VNPQDPLAALKPLREPELIGWWPLAPGWWILIALLVLLIVFLIFKSVQYFRSTAYRRDALKELDTLHQQYQAAADDQAFLNEVNVLLKRVALQAYPREVVAASHSKAWSEFLNAQLNAAPFFAATFSDAIYAPTGTSLDAATLKNTAAHWIAKHRVANVRVAPDRVANDRVANDRVANDRTAQDGNAT